MRVPRGGRCVLSTTRHVRVAFGVAWAWSHADCWRACVCHAALVVRTALTSSKCSPEERDAILTAMWRHIDVVHVQRNACRALQNNAAKLGALASACLMHGSRTHDSDIAPVALSVCLCAEAGSECVVVEALTRAIRRHRHEPGVIEHALSALGNLRFVCGT